MYQLRGYGFLHHRPLHFHLAEWQHSAYRKTATRTTTTTIPAMATASNPKIITLEEGWNEEIKKKVRSAHRPLVRKRYRRREGWGVGMPGSFGPALGGKVGSERYGRIGRPTLRM